MFCLVAAVACGAGMRSAVADRGDAWPSILGSVGFTKATLPYEVVPSGAAAPADWKQRFDGGGLLILEGESELTKAFGFKPTLKKVAIRSIVDERNPRLDIVWEHSVDLFATELPADAKVFAKERWTGAPVLAGFKRGAGTVLWLATDPGENGYARYPYLLQALYDLGIRPAWRGNRLWAFFDYSYRTRVDVEYFTERWRRSGISALHVAAWHFNEPDPERDEYLTKLIDSCHRHGIVVYAWLELPHVSDQFWNDHPQWREKTALLQDAHLDWRKLMNLQNRECFNAVAKQVFRLIDRFDWDGVNLAELYFESLDGADNPARFTPFNDDVRHEFQKRTGVDPVDVVRNHDANGLRTFLDFRAETARNLQQQWIREIEMVRGAQKPWLDLVLTHVDDKFDTRMRDLIGADSGRVLPLLDKHDFSFLIEDPATVWNLGAERYSQIAARYAPQVKDFGRLGIDINIVQRYQDVYPTKQQTGTELFQLVHTASSAFARVALYFENSILAPDIALLPAAAAPVSKYERQGGALRVELQRPAGVAWSGAAAVDGQVWPIRDDQNLWLPAGSHTITPNAEKPALRIVDINADISDAKVVDGSVEVGYTSSTRAIAIADRPLARVEVDGQPFAAENIQGSLAFLPRGSHRARIYAK